MPSIEDFSKYAKVTVNPALPKSEKDLVCALLAGRLRDLFKGKLFCLDLALADLIKDATGYGLSDLTNALHDLQGKLNEFREKTGYDKMLGAINGALAKLGNVFSLGGLCPSPITPPKIPDIMPQVNANLFGQGMNIINALGKVANPKACLSAGPNGLSIDYSQMTGSLAQLKNALKIAANDPLGLQAIAKSFSNNLKMQSRRLQSELNRLERNLADPFGVDKAKATSAALKTANNKGGDYAVLDRDGILHPSAMNNLVPSDTLYLVNSIDNIPILYRREAILDYCGVEQGIRLVPISGDVEYAGWDTNPATDNSDRPFGQHTLPTPSYSEYDYAIVEQDNDIVIYKTDDEKNTAETTSITLERGFAYRIKFELATMSATLLQPTGEKWRNGVEFGYQGTAGHEVVELAEGMRSGELDWRVLIENPSTPDTLNIAFTNGRIIPVTVTGRTALTPQERSYHLSDIVAKALFFQQEKTQTGTIVTKRRPGITYSMNVTLTSPTWTKTSTQDITYGVRGNNVYRYIDDPDSADDVDKIFEIKTVIDNIPYTQQMYVTEFFGISFKQLVMTFGAATPSYSTVVMDSPLTITSDTKLPYTDPYQYKQSIVGVPNVYNDEASFDLINDTTIRFYMTDQRIDDHKSGKILSYYDIDITDIANPVTKFSYFKYIQNKHTFEIKLTYVSEVEYIDPVASVSQPATTLIANQPASFTPVTISNGKAPYVYTVDPALPTSLKLNATTGQITGSALYKQDSETYTVSVEDITGEKASADFAMTVTETRFFNIGTTPILETIVNRKNVNFILLPGYTATTGTITNGMPTSIDLWHRGDKFMHDKEVNTYEIFRSTGVSAAQMASGNYRISSVHMQEIKAVVDYVVANTTGSIYLVGSDFGSVSALQFAISYSLAAVPRVKGIILASPVISDARSGANKMIIPSDVAMKSVTRPVLILYHPVDGCPYCPPKESMNYFKKFINSNGKQLMAMDGGGPEIITTTDEYEYCKDESFHGMIGIEKQTVQAITDFVGIP